MGYYGPFGDNLRTFSLLKQIAQIPQNLLLARVKPVLLCSPFDQFHSRRVDRLRFRVPFQTESEGADHCGGISLGCAWLCSKCTSKHQREKAERHFVPESEERHVVPLETVWT